MNNRSLLLNRRDLHVRKESDHSCSLPRIESFVGSKETSRYEGTARSIKTKVIPCCYVLVQVNGPDWRSQSNLLRQGHDATKSEIHSRCASLVVRCGAVKSYFIFTWIPRETDGFTELPSIMPEAGALFDELLHVAFVAGTTSIGGEVFHRSL